MIFGQSVRRELHDACSQIREELDDHRDAINEGVRDNGEVREVLSLLDEKIEKLSGRIDELFLFLGADATLTSQELALQAYLQTPRSLDEIASYLGESIARADRALRTLALKGVSVRQLGHETIQFTTHSELHKHVSLDNYF